MKLYKMFTEAGVCHRCAALFAASTVFSGGKEKPSSPDKCEGYKCREKAIPVYRSFTANTTDGYKRKEPQQERLPHLPGGPPQGSGQPRRSSAPHPS